MPYYQGDYYMGDPGIFSTIGTLAKRALGMIPGVGPIVSGAAETITSIIRRPGAAGGIMKRTGTVLGDVVRRHPVLTAAGAAGAIGAMGGAGGAVAMRGGRTQRGAPGMKGYHLAKTRHLREAGVWVRNRQMNVANGRALRRSLRRAHGFVKVAMRTIHLIHPRKKGRFGGFKKARRK